MSSLYNIHTTKRHAGLGLFAVSGQTEHGLCTEDAILMHMYVFSSFKNKPVGYAVIYRYSGRVRYNEHFQAMLMAKYSFPTVIVKYALSNYR